MALSTSNPDLGRAISRIEDLMRMAKRPILVAIDGRSGAGKSTIAWEIAEYLGGVNITADDFWVGGSSGEWDSRTPAERAEMAIDWKRIRAEVLGPLLAGKPASWRPFNWAVGEGLAPLAIRSEPKPLVVLDGAYSTRPELQDIIDLSVLVETPDDARRRARLVAREGEDYMRDWHGRWDAAEDHYFSKVRPREAFDLIIANR